MGVEKVDQRDRGLQGICRPENTGSTPFDMAQVGSLVNILVVDNDHHNLRTLSLLLQGENYLVRIATSGQMALRSIQVQLPDLILLDVQMGGMNGFEVCTTLKQSPLTCEIPILFISASDAIEDKVKGFEVGGSDYITKPFQAQEVLMRVRHQLEIRSLQKQLEAKNAELRQAEERYRSIVENSIDGIFQSSPDGQYLSVNPALAHMYGYESPTVLLADLNNIRDQLYVNPHRRDEFVAYLQNHTTVSNFESQVHRADGSIIWISENARAVRDGVGNMLYYEGTVEDVSDRKQVENEVELLLTVTQGINTSDDFQTALTVTIKGICEVTGWVYGEVWVPSPDGKRLECHPAWHLNCDRLDLHQRHYWQTLRTHSEGLALLPGQGLPTQVWQRQQSIWLSDGELTSEALSLRESLAQGCGVRLGAGFPILTHQGQVLAVLVFWSDIPQEQSGTAMKLVDAVTMQLGAVLHNKQIMAKLAGLFAAMRDIILVFDSQGCCLEVVTTRPELLYAPSYVQVGENLRELLPIEQATYFCTCIRQSLETNQPIAVEYQLPIQGQERWFSAHISPISEDRVIWVARDVTKRKRSEAVLHQQEAELAQTSRFLDSIIETMPMAVFAKDVNHDFRYVLWNRAAEEMYGIDRQHALGRTLHELVSPDMAEQISREHQPLVENRQLVIVDEIFQSEFQRQIWQRVRKLPILDHAGQVSHLLYLAEDITEYKRLEAELKQTEDNYRSIVENAIDGIFQTSPGGDYLSANLALAKMYGYGSPEELLTQLQNSHQLYINPNDRDRFIAEIQPTGFVSHFEVEVYCKDGSTIWVEENAREVRDAQGNLLYYEGIVTDITRRRQAEVALRLEKEKSERLLLNILPASIANRLKDDNSAIAESYEEVSILFADIVGFTSLSARMQPIQIVNLLNHLFSEFDQLVDHYHLEKIKTVGDAYMVAAGLPIPRSDHADAIARLAIAMQTTVQTFATTIGEPLQLRIGINSGVVVAGVIGTKKFIYDLWGDTVNVASRMESQGEAGKIQVTEATYQRLKEHYRVIPRGSIEIKGRGQMYTYWLTD